MTEFSIISSSELTILPFLFVLSGLKSHKTSSIKLDKRSKIGYDDGGLPVLFRNSSIIIMC